jgi:hypothetical protein
MRDVLYALAWAVMVLPPLVVFVWCMFLRPEPPPRAPQPQPDKGHMTRSGVPYVMGKTL